eukprot:Amastigsp_a2111_31.p3 type:complete len:204 gc:universal Amastigsp_a2111_31:1390-779(-)
MNDCPDDDRRGHVAERVEDKDGHRHGERAIVFGHAREERCVDGPCHGEHEKLSPGEAAKEHPLVGRAKGNETKRSHEHRVENAPLELQRRAHETLRADCPSCDRVDQRPPGKGPDQPAEDSDGPDVECRLVEGHSHLLLQVRRCPKREPAENERVRPVPNARREPHRVGENNGNVGAERARLARRSIRRWLCARVRDCARGLA